MSDNINEIKEIVDVAYNVAKKDYILTSFLFAFMVALVRIARDQSETSSVRQINEAFVCGLLTVTGTLGLQALMLSMGIDEGRIPPMMYAASIFIGGAVGNLGSQWTRNFARRVADAAKKKFIGDAE